jgi:hypothetical protein
VGLPAPTPTPPMQKAVSSQPVSLARLSANRF